MASKAVVRLRIAAFFMLPESRKKDKKIPHALPFAQRHGGFVGNTKCYLEEVTLISPHELLLSGALP